MSQKHFLLLYLEEAERDSTKDFSLSMVSKHQFTEFFRNTDNKEKWNERLDSLKKLNLKRSPLFEAIFLFGQWKIENDFKKAKESANKFQEIEDIALKNGWVWILAYCLESIAYIYKVLGYRKELNLHCRRIALYLSEKKDIFPAHTLLELARLFNEMITNADEMDAKVVMEILVELSEKKYGADPFNFQRSFLFEAIKSAKFLKIDDLVKELQDKAIANWIDEANFKGATSKLIKVSILERALDYSAEVGSKKRITELKKMLSEIDVSGEMRQIKLPEDQIREYEKAIKAYYDKLKESVPKYVNGLTKLSPINIIWNVCNDDSIVSVNVKKTKDFVQELIQEHPIQQIFGTTLYGEKTIRLESREEKEKYQLNKQLMSSVSETIWVINQIFVELTDKNLFTISAIGDFLANCPRLSENNFQLIGFGALHHFQREFVASISILTPLIEGVLADYLSSAGVDISSYEGKVIEKRELGGLLNLEDFKKIFGENFQYFLKLLLVEADSVNFRNRLAHGKAMLGEFNETVSTVILFVILKICSKAFSIKYK